MRCNEYIVIDGFVDHANVLIRICHARLTTFVLTISSDVFVLLFFCFLTLFLSSNCGFVLLICFYLFEMPYQQDENFDE